MKFTFLTLFLYFTIFLQLLLPQSDEDWKVQTEKRFFQFMQAPSPTQLNSMKVEIWTVQPGVTLTTAFGHSAIRIYLNQEMDAEDYYLEFGMYDPSLTFIINVIKGDALYYTNVVPTISAYNSWDSSGRGVSSLPLNLDLPQKEKLLKEILEVYQKNKEGYLYHNFTKNCVTFIRDILSKSLEHSFEFQYVEEKRDTWRERVIPYSSTILWLNFSETLLFDKDTDLRRSPYELTYLPDDLEKAVERSPFASEKKKVLPHRWLPQSNNGRVIWILIFFTILVFSIPHEIFKKYESLANKLFSVVSVIGGSYSLLVVATTSFDFMNDSITWLILNPLDSIFYKDYNQWKQKKVFWYIFIFRIFTLLMAISLKFTILPQSIGNLLFLSVYFYVCFIVKHYKQIQFK